jgi:hypothetical protein
MAAVAKTESPFTFQQQIQDWLQRRWELEMSWPPMTAAQAAPVQAFIDALGGVSGTFLAGDPLGTSPRGTGNGNPISSGANNISGSEQLVTAGWTPNQAGILLPRDYLEVFQGGSEIVSVQALSGVVSLVALGFLPWLEVGNSFDVAGTGIADGGPFVSLTYYNVFQTGVGYLTSISYSDPEATNGTAYSGLISQPNAPTPRLYRVMTQTPINSDGGGNATIDIFPPIRETIPSGVSINLYDTVGTFRMSENRVVDEMDSKKTITIGIKAVEAI